ncbi:hypothetical protein BDR06DRAFT_966967 [Suillus hirtellus]|nr:hypothetical protein BDR06DRAFT_966967 [Suillus hirtellus]
MSNGINICEDNDAAMVWFLSELPELKPSSSNIVHLKCNDLTRGQLQQSVSEALSHNKPVIIQGSGSNSATALDAEYLEKIFGILPWMHVTIHGLPTELQLLYHGLIYGWNQTTVDCPIHSGKVHPDNFTTKSWLLLHHAGFVSHPHHNADGTMTFVQIETGIKFWVVFHTRNTLSRTAFQKAQMLFANFAKNQEEIILTWEAEVITLLDGDILFQPAGQVHAVYTPKKSFVTGGNLHNFGSLHLTEIFHYINAHKAQFLTNQDDNSSSMALTQLQALISLCLMVINHNKYKASNNYQGYKIVESESMERAVAIATVITSHFYKDIAMAQ